MKRLLCLLGCHAWQTTGSRLEGARFGLFGTLFTFQRCTRCDKPRTLKRPAL